LCKQLDERPVRTAFVEAERGEQTDYAGWEGLGRLGEGVKELSLPKTRPG